VTEPTAPAATPLHPDRWHELRVGVLPADIDEMDHVNNIVYLRWIEEVARAHAARVGLDTPRLRELGTLPVVRRHDITYHVPALPGDGLLVRTEILSAGGVRATRYNTVRRASDGALLADCTTDWVWIDPLSGRPKRLPAEILRGFGFEG
jgi:acyl-CoA thioester hydrolase